MRFNNSFYSNAVKSVLICLVLFFWVGQIPENWKWAFSARASKKGRLLKNQIAWKHSAHGDLAAYAVFLKAKLFIDPNSKQVLFVPDRNLSSIPFIQKFLLGIPSVYLFPTSVRKKAYHFQLNKKQNSDLLNSKKLTTNVYENPRLYKRRQYHLIANFNAKDHLEWGLFVYEDEDEVNVFTLPIDAFDSTKKSK